ncbi:MAG TPA: flavin reductase family protein [Micromonosporaceae bacterium]|nr:flavin reductase family protein [Micromonosporaceae bacterium]
MPASSEDFRSLMGTFPTGVAVVTAMNSSGQPRGMTCSSLCSVSLTPPILLVCLRHGSSTLEAVLDQGRFSVNLLHSESQVVAELFASAAALERFHRVDWHMDPDGCGPHLTVDAHSIADCEVSTMQHVGDHAVVFGTVLRISRQNDQSPLLYGLRRFTTWPLEQVYEYQP